jgi:hypothetical protein
MISFIKQHDTGHGGTHNGYAVIPEGHDLHGMHYDQLNAAVDVHGGLTFSDQVEHLTWPELACAPAGGWVVGFDTKHSFSDSRVWDADKVTHEAQRLKAQLDRLRVIDGKLYKLVEVEL